MTHVPYRGQTPAITDVLRRTDSARIHDHGRRDRSRAGGKARSARHVRRRSATSSFPTRRPRTSWAIRSVIVVGWSGLLAPAGTPPQIIGKLHGGMAKALAMPDVKEAILKQGSKAVSSSSPDEFERYIKCGDARSSTPSSRPPGWKGRSRADVLRREDASLRPADALVQHDPGAGILGGAAAGRLAAHRARGLSRHHPGRADALRARARNREPQARRRRGRLSSSSRRPRRRSPRARATTAS